VANFGWAYVNCTDESEGAGQAAGPTGSVQFLTGHNSTLGVAALVYHTASDTSLHPYSPNTLVLSGNLLVTGSVSASVFHYEDITRIDATGSTFFGNTNDDTHMRTGSLVVTEAGAGPATNFVLSASATQKVVSVAGFAGGYTAVSATPTTLTQGSHIYGVTRTTATTLVFPSASAVPVGLTWIIKDEVPARTGGGNNITLTGTAGGNQLFDNEGTYVLTGTMPAISVYSNGTNWFVF
jgi:hypothetical protein|tara:strand:- start:9511 stop:10224 length:714 start_codon:yes stop_codon:yes gene_type:complete